MWKKGTVPYELKTCTIASIQKVKVDRSQQTIDNCFNITHYQIFLKKYFEVSNIVQHMNENNVCLTEISMDLEEADHV